MITLKKFIRSGVARSIAVWAVILYARLYISLGRCVIHNRETLDGLVARGPFIICFWHSRILLFPFVWNYPVKVHILISHHRDGQMIARVSANFGIGGIMGSASKGGSQALRGIIRTLKGGDCVGITPDGPRGPRMRVSPGTVHTARMAGVPIVPVAISASRRKVANSWDRFIVPMPISRFEAIVGEPMEIDRNADETQTEAARLKLENQLIDMTRRIEEGFGLTPVEPAPPANQPTNTAVDTAASGAAGEA